jgi:aspartate racemase
MIEKAIGIVGGMGPEATLDLYREIIRATPAQKDQDHLRVLIDSNPKIPDRTPAIVGEGENPVAAMAVSCRAVQKAGADFIIIPCISAHYFLDELQQEIDIPILSAFDAVSDHITNHHPEIKTVGLLATSGTVQGERFAERLAVDGITAVVPDTDNQAALMDVIYKIKSSQDSAIRAQCKANLIAIAAHVVARGAQGIIAGCTEIPLELKQEDLSVPFLNSLEILATAAVNYAISKK